MGGTCQLLWCFGGWGGGGRTHKDRVVAAGTTGKGPGWLVASFRCSVSPSPGPASCGSAGQTSCLAGGTESGPGLSDDSRAPERVSTPARNGPRPRSGPPWEQAGSPDGNSRADALGHPERPGPAAAPRLLPAPGSCAAGRTHPLSPAWPSEGGPGRAWALLAAGDPRGQSHCTRPPLGAGAQGPALLPGARPLSLRPRAACPRPSANFYLTADTP